MKKLFNISFLVIAFSFCSQAQSDTSFKLTKIITGDIVDFTVDNLDNIYILNSRNQIKKLNANGDSVAISSDSTVTPS